MRQGVLVLLSLYLLHDLKNTWRKEIDDLRHVGLLALHPRDRLAGLMGMTKYNTIPEAPERHRFPALKACSIPFHPARQSAGQLQPPRAILCLTIGIGVNAAVLSWIEGILFRSYPADGSLASPTN